ncbi:ABC transporter substrate-binding protein [Massilia terrae]|uniref:ABC transporter substrate-binding protein n=1 Tax=Massilia terrae TaxID=1811224 RepID=A0ABT2D4L2_9BURK|nr:ABC transporter substrate-binding protein [Massilia terrae]MCS0661185.1 ABC transporter substrate-binding protein [Massilia terrae]
MFSYRQVRRGLAALALMWAAGAASGTEITIACGSVGTDIEVCRKLMDEWSAKTGNKVRIFLTPNSTTDQLALYRQQFGAHSGEVDVLMVDIVWPGIIKEHLLDLTPYAQGVQRQHFAAIIANNTVGGKLLAMPWFTDAGLLFYRKDLLEKYHEKVPATWEELAATAQRIQDAERRAGKRDLYGYVFEGKAYEGLSCNALEWIASYGGGTVVEPDGRISIDNARAAQALDMAARWPGTIAPKNVVSFAEEEARSVFQGGNAVFMRNWSYVWDLAQQGDSKIKGAVGMAALPRGEGGKSVSTLGGWQLAVSKYSKHPAEAADLVMFLTSKEMQKKRALLAGSLPTYPALYSDQQLLRAAPYMAQLSTAFASATARPSTVTADKYNAVSSALWNAAQATLAGRASGAQSVHQLEKELRRVRRGAAW